MRILHVFKLFTLFSLYFASCCAAEHQGDPIYRMGEHAIQTAGSGALAGVLTWAASTSTSTSCCIIYSIGAGACTGAMMVSANLTYLRCREYRQLQLNQHALHNQEENRIRYNLPQAQQVMEIAPQAIQPRLQ